MGFASRRRHDDVMAHEPTQTLPSPSVPILLTEMGFRARERELDQLRAAKRDDIGRRLRDARGYGEPGGNDEYLATREDEAIIDARIATLEAMLAQASVVEHRARPGVVGLGSVVTVDETENGAGARYRLVGIARGAGTRRRLDQLTGGTSTAGTPRKRNRHREPSRRSHPAAADRLRCAADLGNLLAAALRSRRADANQYPARRRPARRVRWMARMPALCRRGGRRSSARGRPPCVTPHRTSIAVMEAGIPRCCGGCSTPTPPCCSSPVCCWSSRR